MCLRVAKMCGEYFHSRIDQNALAAPAVPSRYVVDRGAVAWFVLAARDISCALQILGWKRR